MSFSAFEEQFTSDVVKKIILPAETYYDAQELLSLVGISHFGYFPDITNLVRDLKYELDIELDKAIEFVKTSKRTEKLVQTSGRLEPNITSRFELAGLFLQ